MLLCVIMLVSTMIIPLSAAGNKGGLGSIADVSDILNALSYADYRKNYVTEPKGEGEIIIDVSDDENCLVKDDTTADYSIVDWQGKEDTLYVPGTGSVTWKFNVEKAGNFLTNCFCFIGHISLLSKKIGILYRCQNPF